MKRWLCGFLFLVLLATGAAGQKNLTDSVYMINGVDVTTDRFSNSVCGVRMEHIDSVAMKHFAAGDLSQLLLQNTSVYIKSTGVNGMSTVSVRGSGTSQTAVLWNGFNIQNPMNGGLDISMIPVDFMNKISVQYNGMAALYGGGAMGGAIHLSNDPVYNKGLDVSVGGYYASFRNYSVNLQLGLSRKKSTIMVKAFYHEGKNDFSFINIAKYAAPREKQTNSESVSYGVMHDKAIKINNKNQLTIRLWIQESKRQIPPLMTQEYSNARQGDDFFRPAVEWINKGAKYKLFVRSALLIDKYTYKDPDRSVNSASGSTASVTESEIYFKIFPFHTMNVGVHYKYTSGYCDYYLHRQSQQEVSAFVSYTATGRNDQWKLNIGLREEYSNNSFVPVLPSVAMDVRLYKDLFLYFNVSRNYRIPTLNDLYWNPGGNPGLKPESGFAEELGVRHMIKRENISFSYSVSGFNNNTKNWIIWLPVSSYWSPQNIQSVWSKGAEIDLRLHAQVKLFRFGFSGKVAYVNATVQQSSNESAIGQQLIYTPEWIAHAGLNVSYRLYDFGFNAIYNSRCYTAPDNSDFLEPYVLGNLYASRDFHCKAFTVSVFFGLNNIWNQTYQSVAWQAMPGINFKTGIQINFKHSLKKKS